MAVTGTQTQGNLYLGPRKLDKLALVAEGLGRGANFSRTHLGARNAPKESDHPMIKPVPTPQEISVVPPENEADHAAREEYDRTQPGSPLNDDNEPHSGNPKLGGLPDYKKPVANVPQL